MATINTTAKKRHYLRYNNSSSEWELIHFYTEWDTVEGKPTLSISGQTITIGSNDITVPTAATTSAAGLMPKLDSASVATQSQTTKFLREDGTYALATARAGNVIGGGDWAKDRLIPDCIPYQST